jgi:hypothetical protein
MRNVRRRLHMLERLPQFQPPPSPLEQIRSLALRQVSDEDLELMINMTRDRDQGVCRALLQSELAALARRAAALETEARHMGFRSFAEAKRHAGQRR